MKRTLIMIAAAGYALTAMTAAIAAPAKAAPKAKHTAKHAAKAAATLKCPSCGMPMPTKKSAMMTVPVKVGKKTYYCCSQCPSGKKAAAAAKKK